MLVKFKGSYWLNCMREKCERLADPMRHILVVQEELVLKQAVGINSILAVTVRIFKY